MPKLTISTENSEYQIIRALKTNRTKRHQSGEAFVEGIESIKQAARAQMEITRIITSNLEGLSLWSKNLIRKNRNAKIIQMKADLYKSLCDRDEPSEIIVTVRFEPVKLQEIKLPPKPFLLVFDRPSDSGNLGSLIRSANSFAVDAILIIGHSVDAYDPKVIRSSLGSIFHSLIVQVETMPEFEEWIDIQKKKNGMHVVGTDSNGEVSLLHHALAKPIAIVLGNETKGMSVALKALCDYVVNIPVSGVVNSLNVACAGSIILWNVFNNSQNK